MPNFSLPWIDIAVIIVYMLGSVLFGCWFYFRSRSPEGFTKAGGTLPSFVVGLSIFGTYVSSISFLALPGKAFASNWNAFGLSLTIPFAAWIATRWFVPYYRKSGEVSAYAHLEHRFGTWARVYASICYMLTQFARMGSVLFLLALPLHHLLGWDVRMIIIVVGAMTAFYSMLGGVAGIVWTEAVQSVILIVGALTCAIMLPLNMPEGPAQMMNIAAENQKFSFGSMSLTDFSTSTFLVVFLYGTMINLQNFGIDQNYVQRYLASKSDREAKKSVWLGALLYLPISAFFFFIGTALFAYYTVHPQFIEDPQQVAKIVGYDYETDADAQNTALSPTFQAPAEFFATEHDKPTEKSYRKQLALRMQQDDAFRDKVVSDTPTFTKIASGGNGDGVFPYFIVHKLPRGMTGLLIAAILAAAMSTIGTSMNGCATLTLTDFYKRFFRPDASKSEQMWVLYISTFVWGALGVGCALLMIQAKGILDAYWMLAGIFSGGMVGIFLLGFLSRRATSAAAMWGAVAGVLVILWMTLSPKLPDAYAAFRCPLHNLMITVCGTVAILVVGFGLTVILGKKR